MFVRRESLKQYIAWYPVTSVIIAVNIILLVLMEIDGSSENVRTLLKFGAMFKAEGFVTDWWRFVTAIGLHIGWMHLLFNSFALYVFAPPLEWMLGKWRYGLLYVMSGVTGNLFSYWFQSDQYIGAGASGAIYGVYAAYIFLALFRKDIMNYSSRKTIQTIVIIGVIYSIIVPRVDLWAHLGGFAGGFVIMALIVFSIVKRYKRYR